MVVGPELPVADVCFVIEGTANLAAYCDTIKTNYILPALEHFTGGPPDDRDYGYESCTSITQFAIVVYQTVEVAPDSATYVLGPTSNSHKLMQLFDKIQFVGGGAEIYSQLAEGLATALQCFDDFGVRREQHHTQTSPTVEKHCILICNSQPYQVPVSESISYNNHSLESLMTLMQEREINFSVFAPRRISFLNKLYEKSGGDLAQALQKSYARDRRHLILLRGFQLPERPVSPTPVVSSTTVLPSDTKPTPGQTVPQPPPPAPPTTQGVKRPGSPAQAALPAPVPPAMRNPQPQAPVQQPPMTGPPTPNSFPAPLPKVPTPDLNMSRSPRGVSPSAATGPTPPGMGNVPQPGQTWNQTGGPGPCQMPPVSQPGPPVSSPVLINQLNANIRGQGQRMSGQAPFRNQGPTQFQQPPPSASPVNSAPSPVNSRHIPSPATPGQPHSVPSPMPQQMTMAMQSGPGGPPQMGPGTVAQQGPPQLQPNQQQKKSQLNNLLGPIQAQADSSSGPNMLGPGLGGPGPMQQQQLQPQAQPHPPQPNPNTVQATLQQNKQQAPLPPQPQPGTPAGTRKFLWQGVVEYAEKGPPGAPMQQPPGQKVTYTLPCSISCPIQPNQPEPDIGADKWPNKLVLQLLPRSLFTKLFPILKNASAHVGLHFLQNDSEGFEKLSRLMAQNFVGCVQFQNQQTPQAIRMMIVVYMADRKLFMGFIPNDQEQFFSAMKSMIDQHRRDQQSKQMGQVGGQIKTEGAPGGPPQMNMGGPGMPMNQGVPVQVQMGPGNQGPNTVQAQLMAGQPGPQQQQNVLLNQALGPINPQQQQQPLVGPGGAGPGSLQQQNQLLNAQLNVPTTPSQIPPGGINPSDQLINVTGAPVSTTITPSGQTMTMGPGQIIRGQLQLQQNQFDQLTEKQKNQLQIQKLKAMLEAAQQKEAIFEQQGQQQQQQQQPGPFTGQVMMQPNQQQQPMMVMSNVYQQQQQPQMNQMIQQLQPQNPMPGQGQPQPQQMMHQQQQPNQTGGMVRQQLQQHLHQQSQAQQARLVQQQQQQQVAGVTSNPQLRHLLQSQQIRGPGPNQGPQPNQMMMGAPGGGGAMQPVMQGGIRLQQQLNPQQMNQMNQQRQQQWANMQQLNQMLNDNSGNQ